ncbi:hypothetical protein [Burkholderia sp. Ac-20353]|uniref:hypothetical protein n=1 Tax=Burkholderia sp. Ac-20353 TaxID=2703894 RepID=UPI00197B8BC0|nr:hypothetical protein [Burkholderia sp. Ac-20353]
MTTLRAPSVTGTYNDRGYPIEVRGEPTLDESIEPTPVIRLNPGDVVVDPVRAGDPSSIFFAPVRFAEDGGRPYADRLDALSTGRPAVEVIVDDLRLDADGVVQAAAVIRNREEKDDAACVKGCAAGVASRDDCCCRRQNEPVAEVPMIRSVRSPMPTIPG